MLKHIAVRLKRQYDGKIGFQLQNSQVINSNLIQRDPALKNVSESLHKLGLKYDISGCRLFWYQIDDDKPVEWYNEFNEVELAFASDWFEDEKSKIRNLSGYDYIHGCERLAEKIVFKDQDRIVEYNLPESR